MGNCCRRATANRPVLNWGALVKRILKIRKLQSLFAFVGHHLQRYPKALLNRVALTYPKQD